MVIDLSSAGPALIALAGAAALALVNSWITARAGIDHELRTRRLEVYPPLWHETSLASRWPRSEVSRARLERLHRALRAWYYGTGGLFLSARSRARYGDVQELIGALLEHGHPDPTGHLTRDRYEDLMGAMSALRTALTEDLDTRRRTSIAERVRRWAWHVRAGRWATARKRRAGWEPPPRRHPRLRPAGPGSAGGEPTFAAPGEPTAASSSRP